MIPYEKITTAASPPGVRHAADKYNKHSKRNFPSACLRLRPQGARQSFPPHQAAAHPPAFPSITAIPALRAGGGYTRTPGGHTKIPLQMEGDFIFVYLKNFTAARNMPMSKLPSTFL